MQELPGDDFTHTLLTAQNLDCTSSEIQHLNHTQDPEASALLFYSYGVTLHGRAENL